jgi:Ca-activated chloride channel family protein
VTLLAPGLVFLLLLVPAAILWRRRRGMPSVLFAPGADGLPRSWRVRLLFLPRLVQVAGLVLVAVALARPARQVAIPQVNEGIDIMLCLDTSSSMKANDLDPRRTRLDVAKSAAATFVTGRPDDRIGLVSFARYPDLLCPPTRDHEALLAFLAALEQVEGDGPEDATGIGTAVARAAQVLGAGGTRSKVVILLTDGEENVATADKPKEIAPLHAGQLCARLGVRVYAIAAGSGPRDPQVQALTGRTGGRYFEARDAGAVAQVYAGIGALEKAAIEDPRLETVEGFMPFLAGAIVLLLCGRLLETVVRP